MPNYEIETHDYKIELRIKHRFAGWSTLSVDFLNDDKARSKIIGILSELVQPESDEDVVYLENMLTKDIEP